MANSLLSSIFGMLDPQIINRVAAGLGAPGPSVSQGLKTSIATILGGLASKSGDSHALQTILDLNPAGLADTTASDIARAATEPGSSLIAGGHQILAGLFGPSQSGVTQALSSASGLGTGVASTLLSMAAPLVLSFITKRVRSEGLSMTGLGNLLTQESGTIRDALPAGVAEQIRSSATGSVSPVVAQTVQAEPPSSLRWLAPLIALGVLIPGLLWLMNRSPRVTLPETSQVVPPGNLGTANRLAPEANRMSPIDRGVVLMFNTGSSTLLPGSEARLNQIASTLKANPDVHATIEGYTDSVGSAESNMTLSRQRADSVMSELAHKGIAADRLSAEGHGQDNPIADNSTLGGRAQNRRVTVSVSRP